MPEASPAPESLIDIELAPPRLHGLRDLAERWALYAGFNHLDAGKILSGVDEALANIHLHSYGSRPGPVHLEIRLSKEELIFEISDHGKTFDLEHGASRKAGEVGARTLTEAYQRLVRNRSVMRDLAEVVDWARGHAPRMAPVLRDLPATLELHGTYSSTEINAMFGANAFEGGGSRGVGVVHFENQRVVVHLVTFEKNEKQFSETTMYRDFPTAPDLLHWESQAAATQPGKMGRIYANHEALGYRILFFTRIRKQAAVGVTSPFLFLGAGRFIDAIGNRPIAIRWKLEHPMPIAHYREARLASGMED